MREELERDGIPFTTGSDSEVIAQLLANAPGIDWKERWAHVMRKLNGAYSLAVLTPDALMMARDPMGNRPLCLGRIDGGWIAASESCALPARRDLTSVPSSSMPASMVSTTSNR